MSSAGVWSLPMALPPCRWPGCMSPTTGAVGRTPRHPPSMSDHAALSAARSWQEAMNARDAERLVALAHDDVEVEGPRGLGRGTDLLRAWMDRQAGQVGLHLEARRWFARGDTVVVDQLAEWRGGRPRAVAGRPEGGGGVVGRDG